MNSSMSVLILSAVLTSAAAAQEPEAGSDWPQWRGPTRDGQGAGKTSWPDRLSGDALTPLWRIPLGPSYSGPVVSGDRVFTTETKDRAREVVRALDRVTGKLLWETSWEGAMSVPFFAKANGDWIRSTPALDGDRLYVAGIRDVLVCLDAPTGKELWRVDFVKRLGTPLPDFGFVCSPLVDGDFLYVQAAGAFVKLEKLTGKILWKTLENGGGMNGSAFSSPMPAKLGGRRQMLVQTRSTLAGVDPADGAVLWSRDIPAFRGMNILTPTVWNGGIFTSSYGGKSVFLRILEKEGRWEVAEEWTNSVQAYMSTPVVVGGHAYVHLRNQRFACFDLSNGRQTWISDARYGQYWSLIAHNGKILALDEKGDLLLLRADPAKFEILDSRRVSDQPTWAHLSLSGGDLFIRELNGLTAFRWSQK